ncbi:unnamed protein product, partial [Gulo gulo]
SRASLHGRGSSPGCVEACGVCPCSCLAADVCLLPNALGATAGAHRGWSHRSYKARLPLRICLAAANSMAFQNDIFEWARDHRVHHKYSETDADPHNARRGFFFSHIGWLFVRRHGDVIEKGRNLTSLTCWRILWSDSRESK